jgi:hypothetical protein
VRLLNLANGKVVWSHPIEGEASFAGEPPQIRAWCGTLLIAVRRNHGVELYRFGIEDGKSLWNDDTAFFDAAALNLWNADIDSERAFIPAGDSLAGIALRDGKSIWEVELPCTNGASDWIVRAGQKCLIVYSQSAVPREATSSVANRLIRSFLNAPELWRLPVLATGLYDAWVARSVPVLLLDPESGRQLACLDIPAFGPVVTTWFEGDTGVIATGNRVVWLR